MSEMKNEYLSEPSKIVNSGFLNKTTLVMKLHEILRNEKNLDEFLLGAGVSEVLSSAAYEFTWNIVKILGKVAEERFVPGKKLKVNYFSNNVDLLRKDLGREEKKPKEASRNGNRVIHITKEDIIAARKLLPRSAVLSFMKKELENENKNNN